MKRISFFSFLFLFVVQTLNFVTLVHACSLKRFIFNFLQNFLTCIWWASVLAIQVQAGCLPCWRQLTRCVVAEPCAGTERIKPTVEVMAARILRDCPMENSGPCPVVKCDECPVCPTCDTCSTCPPCEPCTTPATTTTALTTTQTTTTSTPCQKCECTKDDLQKCRNSLSFVDLSKGGAQTSRVTWKEEAERLAQKIKREENSTASYKEKWEEVLELFKECQIGYTRANGTIDFSVRLVNEHSGRADSCERTLQDVKNTTATLSDSLSECQNRSTELTGSLEVQTTNFTTYGRFLRDCRRNLRIANEKRVNISIEMAGKFFLILFFLNLNFSILY